MIVTDKEGERYGDSEEAMQALGVKRSTLQKRVATLPKYRQEGDRRIYYRMADIEALKERPVEMHRIDGNLLSSEKGSANGKSESTEH